MFKFLFANGFIKYSVKGKAESPNKQNGILGFVPVKHSGSGKFRSPFCKAFKKSEREKIPPSDSAP